MRFLVFLAAPQVPFWQDGRFSLALTGMLLAGVLLLGAMIVAWVGRSFKDDRKRGICSPEDQLSEFRTMLEAGELTPKNSKSLSGNLGVRSLLKILHPRKIPLRLLLLYLILPQKKLLMMGFPRFFP